MTENERQGIALGDKLIHAMHAWADEHGREASAQIPLIALHFALVRCLKQIPSERRQQYADDFSKSLFRAVRKTLD